MKILILDDREDGRYLLETLLRANGHEVVSVSNGAAALEKMQAGRFDLIISDILMPVMDGFQFCQKVKTDEALRGIPFIFYTATYTGPQDEEFAHRIGADRFLRKPCEPQELMATIKDVVDGKGRQGAARATVPEEEVLRLYSERLVRKLEQKMLEAERDAHALADEKQKFQTLVEELPLGVALIDANEAFRYVNPRFTELFGYVLADLPTLDAWLEKAHPDPRRREEASALLRVTKSPGALPLSRALTTQIRCRCGTDRQVRVHPSRLASGERLVIFEDVTEQVDLENKLRQAQKMEALATLAGGIAHDFNNILAGVMGFAELAAREIPAESNAAHHLAGVLQATRRAKDLVSNILAFSRRTEQDLAPIALHLVVKEALTLLRSTLPPNIEIREHLDRGGVVLAVGSQMHQVVMNLCTNAFHAMGEKGGQLQVGLKRVSLTPAQAEALPGLKPGPYLQLSVSDSGCGMPPEVLPRIFDPYFTTKTEGEGTGLGLSVTHGIVRAHQGAIDVTSVLGQGSTFRVYLPCLEQAPEAHSQAERPPVPLGRERVLFLDDEPELASLGQKMLESLGYRVTATTTPAAALDLLRRDPAAIDLVVTDYLMPRMTGLELAQEVRRLRADLPVLLCSGSGTTTHAQKARDLGFVHFLHKPFSRQELATLVRQVLDEGKGGKA
ncbi:MAG: response regulator [Candidatus Riflebacteria bacterium]|nr:response regulator [Candidatus Riflebacteria bacterium]